MMDQAGRVPLHYAALEGDLDGLRAELEVGADPDARDAQGFTPLHFTAQEYHVAAARELIAAGGNVNARNAWGNGPLFFAVMQSAGRGEMIRLLLESGADPLAANKAGHTPVGLARTIANVDVDRFFID